MNATALQRTRNFWSHGDVRRCTVASYVRFVGALLVAMFPALTEAGAVTVAWDPNPGTVTAGYLVYFGTQSGKYAGYVDVGKATSALMNTADSTGTYYFAVQAYSTSGLRSELSVEVSWKPTSAGQPSLINPGSMTNIVGQSVAVRLAASDPGGLTLTHAAAGLPPGLSIASASGLISGMPTTVGAFNVTAKATNTAGLSATQLFTWSILTQTTLPPGTSPGNGGGSNGGGGNGGGNGDSNGGGNGSGNPTPSPNPSPVFPGPDPAPADLIDNTAPTIIITSPTFNSTYKTTSARIILTGAVTDDVGVVSVTWTNDRGGEGVATTSNTSFWTTFAIELKDGPNLLTVTATDAAGNTRTATLSVTREVDLYNRLN